MITVGGSSTLHDITFASAPVNEFQDKLAQVMANPLLGSLQVLRTDSRTLDTITLLKQKEHAMPAIFLKAAALPEIHAHKDLNIKVDGYVIDMDVELMAADRSDEDRAHHIAMIKEASAGEKQVRIMLRVDLSSDSAVDGISTGSAIGDLCDAGASIIILEHHSEQGKHIDADKVRETIEEACYLDISGAPINQRLGLVSQDKEAMEVAVELGCIHYVTNYDNDEDRALITTLQAQ